jgi:hypothetical protein
MNWTKIRTECLACHTLIQTQAWPTSSGAEHLLRYADESAGVTPHHNTMGCCITSLKGCIAIVNHSSVLNVDGSVQVQRLKFNMIAKILQNLTFLVDAVCALEMRHHHCRRISEGLTSTLNGPIRGPKP